MICCAFCSHSFLVILHTSCAFVCSECALSHHPGSLLLAQGHGNHKEVPGKKTLPPPSFFKITEAGTLREELLK